ncbi:hypothetical protein [Sphingomonas abaci]|jgi:hypothetical protein|uniref:Uncharacterized protein n=1 Tax=Sphingomonas abaci TaxID=237611 RepID=A0A7W7AK21_9SPHN|nr:hypothetical protein [Sphingomonas abaci]MBB4617699.1 hypothetical protein [Sphingomonas abaci]
MLKIVATKFAALALTVVLSGTCIMAAVGPAQGDSKTVASTTRFMA